MAAVAISREDVIDAEFETVLPAAARQVPHASHPPAGSKFTAATDNVQLDILRQLGESVSTGSHPDRLTPGFLVFTGLTAIVVFWVSGGHSLLY